MEGEEAEEEAEARSRETRGRSRPCIVLDRKRVE